MFLGYKLTDKIPNHSTISQNRRRRFIYQKILNRHFWEDKKDFIRENSYTIQVKAIYK